MSGLPRSGSTTSTGRPAGTPQSFGLVAGGLPLEQHDGAIVINDPFGPPPSPTSINTREYLIADYTSENASEHLRNRATIEFAVRNIEVEGATFSSRAASTVSLSRSWWQSTFSRNNLPGNGAGTTSRTLVVNVSAPNDGFTYEDFEFSGMRLEALVDPTPGTPSSYPTSYTRWITSDELTADGTRRHLEYADGETLSLKQHGEVTHVNQLADGSYNVSVRLQSAAWAKQTGTWAWNSGASPTGTLYQSPSLPYGRYAGSTIYGGSQSGVTRAAGMRITPRFTVNVIPPAGDTEIVEHEEATHRIDSTTTTVPLDLPVLTGLAQYQSASIASLDVEQRVTRTTTTTRCVDQQTRNEIYGPYNTEAAANSARQSQIASGRNPSVAQFLNQPMGTGWYFTVSFLYCYRYETTTSSRLVWERDSARSSNAETNSTLALNDATGGTGAVTLTLPASLVPAGTWRIVVGIETEATRPASERSSVVVRNDESIALHGRRDIAFPPWYRFGVYQRAVARLNELAQERHFHTVDLYLSQRDATRATTVAQLDTGD